MFIKHLFKIRFVTDYIFLKESKKQEVWQDINTEQYKLLQWTRKFKSYHTSPSRVSTRRNTPWAAGC